MRKGNQRSKPSNSFSLFNLNQLMGHQHPWTSAQTSLWEMQLTLIKLWSRGGCITLAEVLHDWVFTDRGICLGLMVSTGVIFPPHKTCNGLVSRGLWWPDNSSLCQMGASEEMMRRDITSSPINTVYPWTLINCTTTHSPTPPHQLLCTSYGSVFQQSPLYMP